MDGTLREGDRDVYFLDLDAVLAQAREDHSVALGVVEWTRVASHEFEFHLGLYDGLSVCAPQHLRAEA